jgi:hypothetical protein
LLGKEGEGLFLSIFLDDEKSWGMKVQFEDEEMVFNYLLKEF